MQRHPQIVKMYSGHAWDRCRTAYKKYVGGLCEKCLAKGIYTAGEIVHHKQHITLDTVNDPKICYGFDNLQLVCRKCHAEEHEDIYKNNPVLHRSKKRYKVDEFGRVTTKPPYNAK